MKASFYLRFAVIFEISNNLKKWYIYHHRFSFDPVSSLFAELTGFRMVMDFTLLAIYPDRTFYAFP